MILLIAWRNIWRSRLRSFVVIGAVFMGVWSFIALMAFSTSIVNSYVDNAIRFQTAQLQIHHPQFVEDQELQFILPEKEAIFSALKSDPKVKAFSERTLVNGMVQSPRAARGVLIRGVQPALEDQLSDISGVLVEGKYFTDRKNEILISQQLADKLKVKLRKKIVLKFQDFNKDINEGLFKVVGIYKTGNTLFDLGMVIVKQQDINNLLGNGKVAHEYALLLNDNDELAAVEEKLKADFPDLKIENYREISPDVKLYESQIGISSAIFLTIFMLALIFGIINTMLMAVLERTKELGMLMAVGMNKTKVFFMIVLETLLLGLIGAPLGMLVGWLTVNYFNERGIDLSAFAEGLERFGLTTIIRPELPTEIYLQLMFAVFITAVLAAIYPALKAIRLRPVEAMHKI